MKSILIINAHAYYPSSEGRLNNAPAEKAVENLSEKRYEVQLTSMKDGYDVDSELEKHRRRRWAVSFQGQVRR